MVLKNIGIWFHILNFVLEYSKTNVFTKYLPETCRELCFNVVGKVDSFTDSEVKKVSKIELVANIGVCDIVEEDFVVNGTKVEVVSTKKHSI